MVAEPTRGTAAVTQKMLTWLFGPGYGAGWIGFAGSEPLTVSDLYAARQPTTKADRQMPAATLGERKKAEKLRTPVGR